ncbi:MAG TPA: hypothetical protein PLR06_09930 [Cyclobacteriaceae bacterium]|nr:hypothetical protein [Cyclobacteriaceae bacterium]
MKKKATFWIIVLLASMFFETNAQRAEENVPAGDGLVILVENINSHKQFFLNRDKPIHFRQKKSEHFEHGRITAITDSTFSFVKTILFLKGKKTETRPFADLAVIRVPASSLRKVTGTILVAFGTLFLVDGIGLILSKDELSQGIAALPLVTALIAIPSGMALLQGRKINLKKSWKLKSARP